VGADGFPGFFAVGGGGVAPRGDVGVGLIHGASAFGDFADGFAGLDGVFAIDFVGLEVGLEFDLHAVDLAARVLGVVGGFERIGPEGGDGGGGLLGALVDALATLRKGLIQR